MELIELGTGVAVQAKRRYLRSLYQFHFLYLIPRRLLSRNVR